MFWRKGKKPLKQITRQGKKRARKGQEKLLALIKENPYISISSKAKE